MITVLRLGHRKGRDKRITTHVGLVARAFGADELIISTKDEGIGITINDVTKRFGGNLRVKTGIKWRKILKNWKGTSVHLTMYGEHIDDVIPRIPKNKELLIVVGAEKVPKDVYQMVDFNVGVGNQPHSEVAALGKSATFRGCCTGSLFR
jgi:tRNA (cytidine56-2'-O)-methyltransferase